MGDVCVGEKEGAKGSVLCCAMDVEPALQYRSVKEKRKGNSRGKLPVGLMARGQWWCSCTVQALALNWCTLVDDFFCL